MVKAKKKLAANSEKSGCLSSPPLPLFPCTRCQLGHAKMPAILPALPASPSSPAEPATSHQHMLKRHLCS